MSFLLDPSRFSLAGYLEEHFETFRAEAAALEQEDLYVWGEMAACTMPWYCSPIDGVPAEGRVDVDWVRQRELLPGSTALMEARPDATVAGLSILVPGAHLHSHVDSMPPGTYRMHLALKTPSASGIRIGGDLLRWEEGKVMVFDSKIDHEAANVSSGTRVVLFVSFVPLESERAYVQEALSRIDPKWYENAIGKGMYSRAELADGKCYSRELPAAAAGS